MAGLLHVRFALTAVVQAEERFSTASPLNVAVAIKPNETTGRTHCFLTG
jgi:hypothetical protein